MEKQRHYNFKKIEVCRNCGGTGEVEEEKKAGLVRLMGRMDYRLPRQLATPPQRRTCDVCNGTGRVEKTTETTVTVKSFDPSAASGTPSQRGRG